MSLGWLVFFLLASWGGAYAVTLGKVGAPLRALLKPVPVLGAFVRCPACAGFWIGTAIAWFFADGSGLRATHAWATGLYGLAACGFCRWIAGEPN